MARACSSRAGAPEHAYRLAEQFDAAASAIGQAGRSQRDPACGSAAYDSAKPVGRDAVRRRALVREAGRRGRMQAGPLAW
jgi:hypothetical protein